VLVVDDEPSVRLFTCRVLQREGYRVREASDGAAALRILQQHPREFALLIADLVMPVMDGGELARRVVRLPIHLPVLLVSGYPRDMLKALGVQYPGLPFLQKPFTAEQLTATVRALVGAPQPLSADETMPANQLRGA
jgi:CheY-like chemotaxis protein